MAAYWTFVYDGECAFCRRFAEWITRHDTGKMIETRPLQEKSAVHADIPGEVLEEDVHMFGQSGEVLVGGEVIQKIIDLIPAMRPFRWMLERKTGRKAANAAYLTMKKFRNCPGCGKRKRR